jgi:hypothetical protein
VTVHLKPDGAVDAFEVKGSLTLTATTDAAALCKVQLGLEDKLGFNFQTHPKINKQVYDQSKVGAWALQCLPFSLPTARTRPQPPMAGSGTNAHAHVQPPRAASTALDPRILHLSPNNPSAYHTHRCWC